MALSSYYDAGQTISEAISTRYAAIGEESKRDVLGELFKVRNQQREEVFKALHSLLAIGDSLVENWDRNKEINQAMKNEPGVKKTSGTIRDIFGTPRYVETKTQKIGFLPERSREVQINNQDLFNRTTWNKYKNTSSDLGGMR